MSDEYVSSPPIELLYNTDFGTRLKRHTLRRQRPTSRRTLMGMNMSSRKLKHTLKRKFMKSKLEALLLRISWDISLWVYCTLSSYGIEIDVDLISFAHGSFAFRHNIKKALLPRIIQMKFLHNAWALDEAPHSSTKWLLPRKIAVNELEFGSPLETAWIFYTN